MLEMGPVRNLARAGAPEGPTGQAISNGMGAKILWAIVGGFIFGVFVRSLVPFGLSFIGFAMLLGASALVLGFFDASKFAKYILIAVALFACGVGVARMDAATLEGDPLLAAYIEEKVVLEGVVFDEPDVRENGVHVSLDVRQLFDGEIAIPVRARVLIFAPPHSDISYGDTLRASGTLRLPESFDTGLGRSFNYPGYLAVRGIAYQLAFAEVESVEEGKGNILKALAIGVKQKFLEGLGRAIAEPEAGLAGGITVGDKRGVGEELSEVFRTVSLTHIVVLSGYNIMIVVDTLARVTKRMPRALRFSGGGFVAVFFALMTGLASASVRAAAMAIIAIAGRASGRMYLASRALALVVLGMVAWNPFVLMYDPGFQLSVLATWGLIALAPVLAPRLSFIPSTLGLREIAISTISAQIAVLPLLLYQTGNLSIVGLPANLLVLFVVPWAMFFSTLAALSGLVLGPFAPLLALPALALLSYMISIAKLFAALPFASIAIPAFSAWWMCAAYAILFGGVWLIKNNRAEAVLPPVR